MSFMRTHGTFLIGLVVAAGAIIAGCASGSESPATPSSSALSAPPPSAAAPSSVPAQSGPPTESTTSPAGKPPTGKPLPTITLTDKPPKEPTDKQPSTGWVAGMVTRGGKGPCYGLIADDGQRYALYSTAGTELTQGDRVKVQLETSPLRIYCGPGTFMAMTDHEPIQ
jgi:hypothetical protein